MHKNMKKHFNGSLYLFDMNKNKQNTIQFALAGCAVSMLQICSKMKI